MMFSLSQIKSANGKPRTKSLFYELSYDDPSEALFTLKERDIEVRGQPMLSLQQLYVSMVPSDPTEYEFANKYLGGWKHWQRLQKCFPLKPFIKEWRAELEVKLRSEGIAAQRKLAAKGNVNAAKWLAEKGWDKRKAGTPSKAEIEGERKVAAAMEEHLDDDFDRVFGSTH